MALNQGDTLAKLVSLPKSELQDGETAEPARLRIGGVLVSYTVVEVYGDQDSPDGFQLALKKGLGNPDTEPSKDEQKKADEKAEKAEAKAEAKADKASDAEKRKREAPQGTTSKNLFAK